jgi:hypothetical protein
MVPALRILIDRIETWPAERQERAAEILSSLDGESETDDLQISDEDLAEVQRRIADADAPTMSLEEFREFVAQLGR